jgi:hypothetical protein
MMGEVIVWKLIDIGFDLMVMGMKREEIVNAAKAQQAAGASPEDIALWLQNLRRQKAQEARQAVVDSPED